MKPQNFCKMMAAISAAAFFPMVATCSPIAFLIFGVSAGICIASFIGVYCVEQ